MFQLTPNVFVQLPQCHLISLKHDAYKFESGVVGERFRVNGYGWGSG